MTDILQKIVLFITKIVFGLFIGTICGFVFKCLLKVFIFIFNYMLLINILVYGLIFYLIYFFWINFYKIKSYIIKIKTKSVYLYKTLQQLSSNPVMDGEKRFVKDNKFRSKSKKQD